MDIDATLAGNASQSRQKRVLPSRSRRGGPGVGNCDVDVMILNAQLNKSENEPLIPADTPFVLKTSDTLEKLAEEFSSLAGGSGLTIRAHESYFDRPDVLKAYREQTIIETPEYTNVADVPSVGGRLRVRSVDENTTDTDAAYEKRHRKYEAFEKRQRLREKEKLKHEQYKLKERIEQLRGMDNSAFLAAPASSFSARPGVPEIVEEDPILGGLNGNPAYLEGERRRKEMLMNAQALEERYRVLLPPDRQRKPVGQSSMNVSLDPDSELSGKEFTQPHNDGESELDEDYSAPANKKETQKLKLKLPARPSIVSSPISKTASTSSKKRRRSPPPFHPPPPPPHKSPASVRRPRVPDVTPFVTGREISAAGDPGPSSLVEPLQTNFEPVSMARTDGEVISNLRFLPYVPDSEKAVKRGKRNVHKRAKTEERGIPASPPRDHSVLPPQEYSPQEYRPQEYRPQEYPPQEYPPQDYPPQDYPPQEYPQQEYTPPQEYIVVDEEPPKHDYPSPETTVPPPDAVSSGPVSPLGSEPGLNDMSNDYFASLRRSTPPAEEASLSVPPPGPVEMERKPSVPPIESISAPVTTVTRRGRSRGVMKPVVPRKTPKPRTVPPCMIVSFAERTAKNPRQLQHNRIMAFGVKLPAIIHKDDSYDFELPAEISPTKFEDGAQEGDVTREAEGSQAPDDPDPEDEDEDEEGADERLEPVDDPDEDDTDEDLDGT
ncbi:hypothetical protein B0H19DRAFT_1128677 [Mycena capillaripes]|nr:hypothetical protein B0H19DRAFT_1128677 [Mycena capillaripes]